MLSDEARAPHRSARVECNGECDEPSPVTSTVRNSRKLQPVDVKSTGKQTLLT
jgi:hypothetical protein